jgi:hypothetical protein
MIGFIVHHRRNSGLGTSSLWAAAFAGVGMAIVFALLIYGFFFLFVVPC